MFVHALLVAAAIMFPIAAGAQTPGGALELEGKIPLGAVNGRIDHLAVDLKRQWLSVAELENDAIGVVDLAKRKLQSTSLDLKAPQGIGHEPSTDALYVASAADGSVRMLRAEDQTLVGRVDLGQDADNIRVDEARSRVLVGYGKGAIAIIDPKKRAKVADIRLKAHPESFQINESGTRAFVNVPDAQQIEIVDLAKLEAIGTLPTQGHRANFPMAFDGETHRVLVGFRSPARLLILSSTDGAVVADIDTGGDADDIFVYARRHRVYVICGAGLVDVFEERAGSLSADKSRRDRAGRTHRTVCSGTRPVVCGGPRGWQGTGGDLGIPAGAMNTNLARAGAAVIATGTAIIWLGEATDFCAPGKSPARGPKRLMETLILSINLSATRRTPMTRYLTTLAVVVLVAAFSLPAAAADGDWTKVGEALGKAGTELPGGVYKVGLPRTDIKATLDGVELKPGFALGSWLAFVKTDKDGMVMGDLVLLMDEVSPVMAKLVAGGIQVTALHNHLLRNTPFTMYMHVMGMGDPVKLATTLHAALAESKTPLAAASGGSQPAAAPPAMDLDTAALDQILGAKGSNNGGVLQYGIARAEPVRDGAMVVPPAMGSANAINFQPTGGGKAAITGDFVLTAKEVAPVMKALRDNSIEVTALHQHMLGDEPRLFFMHFWANDDAKKLATGLKAALSHVAIPKG